MRIRVDWRVSCRLVGTILKWLWVPLLLPLGIALYDGTALLPFIFPILGTALLGVGLEQLTDKRDLRAREAFLMVSLTWLSIALVGAVPFVLAGEGMLVTPVNALFESMSGITTTGATVIVDFERHSRAILMWRAVLQWLGGLGILVLATAVLSQLSVGGAQLMETETQIQDVNKLTPRISETAALLWKIYIGLTGLQVAVLYGLHLIGYAPEMTLYDAVAHAFTTISTSGFSPRGDSIAAFSPAVQWAIIPFMAIGATSFILLYFAFQGNFDRLRNSDEFRFYVGLLGFFTVGVGGVLLVDGAPYTSLEQIARHALFQVVSIMTTTGYASTDFNLWSAAAKHLLFVCMFIGGMAGSTTCSIKTLRWLVVVKAFSRDLFTASNPSAVRPVRHSGNVVDEETVRDIYAYTLVSLVFFIVATIFVVVDASRVQLSVTEFEAMSAAAATFFNVGPAFGIAGPLESYEPFPQSTKIVMTFLMWVGRIEIIPVLVLLTPSYWRS
ncbi:MULTISPECIES: TrkH family potassium uptake protein [Haloferax]|uniref:Potassium transporter TrkH n=3 Tax=Haloferax TaxID=2251 RepID=A0A2P4NLY3_9EURY|nr:MULTISPECIES: TrkH family potassium uptake protein [Haloferax]ELZ63958.1 Trk-type transport system (substrate potassium) 1, subunit 2.1 [Haloferax prahovense DSM 18310]POG54130.1 potassium transporter TrkH [Haloferax marisrubri]QOS13380.1 Trk-type transport system (probable substrate potassium) [Haloferax gibbonsii]RDZ40235.1 TrkH family potassium uptake protein [Haloferax sp. Atlit-16N]RDZ56837.1 TrkH family potassium uptake protein [Haloferax sp. Atlit-10N]